MKPRAASQNFRPAWWLPGGHAQTIWGALFRRPGRVVLRTERFRVRDGARITLRQLDGDASAPRALLLHGLEGDEHSHYVQGMLARLSQMRWNATVLVARTCDGRMPRGRRMYHSGMTEDLDDVTRGLAAREPGRPLHLIGWSMGGNIAGKWLGECGDSAPIARAALVCAPYWLRASGVQLDRVLFGIYAKRFLRTLLPKAHRKARELDGFLDMDRLRECRTIVEFDDAVTAPLHGFDGVWDYYDRASSRPHLSRIRVPTLMLSAADDPIVPGGTFPRDVAEKSPWLHPVLVPHGGHIGFVSGNAPWSAHYWAEEQIVRFLKARRDCVSAR